MNLSSEIKRSIRDAPPAHYTLKIQSFSLLSKASIEKIDSCHFGIGGYKWKLSLYPDGKKQVNVKDHLSLYLVIVETCSLPLGWVVNVDFKLFLFDQIRDKYLILQDADGRLGRFHEMKTECGFEKFIPFNTFNNRSNGYLVDDTCLFGVELCVIENTLKGECFSMMKEPDKPCYTWKINKFSELEDEIYPSEDFNAVERKWQMRLYPKGDSKSEASSLSLFLKLANASDLVPGAKVYAEYILRVRDQVNGKHIERKVNQWFSGSTAWGWPDFLLLSELHNLSKGYLVNDTCIVEVDFIFVGVVKTF